MKFGLNNKEYEFIRNQVVEPLDRLGVDVLVFGSRAKGTHQQFSDLDLLLKSNQIDDDIRRKVSQIDETLIESNFPYKVDLVFDMDLADSYRQDVTSSVVAF